MKILEAASKRVVSQKDNKEELNIDFKVYHCTLCVRCVNF